MVLPLKAKVFQGRSPFDRRGFPTPAETRNQTGGYRKGRKFKIQDLTPEGSCRRPGFSKGSFHSIGGVFNPAGRKAAQSGTGMSRLSRIGGSPCLSFILGACPVYRRGRGLPEGRGMGAKKRRGLEAPPEESGTGMSRLSKRIELAAEELREANQRVRG